MKPDIPIYDPHPGTVRISGGTDCKKAAKCALYFLQRKIPNIDFFYIGANAGQQAMKAMGIMKNFVETATEGKSTVLFQPVRVQTNVIDPVNPGVSTIKDAVYWRAYVLRSEAMQILASSYGPTDTITIPDGASE